MKSLVGAIALISQVALAGGSVAGGGIGYAQASNYHKKDSRPTQYQPLNLLDGRDVTAFCTQSADPLNDHLSFGFKAPVKIDEVRITTGNNFDEHTFKEFSRAKKLELKGGSGGHTFSVADQRGPQTVTFNPPIEGARFTLDILDQYPSDDPEASVCLTDVVFVSDGKALNGNWLTTKLKYDKLQAPLMGTWFAGFPGTPDRFLSFYFDGTYQYRFEPYDALNAKPKTIEGSWEASSSKLTLEVPGKGKVAAKYFRDPDKEGGFTLRLDGDVGEELKQAFRSAP